MKIVVTGALGHIGSSLIRAFPIYFPGAEIVLIDNLVTQRFASLFNLPAIGRYRFHEADVREADLRRLFEGAHVVVHLAATTDAAGTANNPAALEAEQLSRNRKGRGGVLRERVPAGPSVLDQCLWHPGGDSFGGLRARRPQAAKSLCRDQAEGREFGALAENQG